MKRKKWAGAGGSGDGRDAMVEWPPDSFMHVLPDPLGSGRGVITVAPAEECGRETAAAKCAELYWVRGTDKMRSGKIEEAIKYFDKAILRKPEFWVYWSRGNARSELGRYEDAIKDYNEALRLAPDDLAFVSYMYRCNAEFWLGRYKDAITDCSKVLKKTGFTWAYYRRGETNNKLDRYEDAIKDFDEAIRGNPGYAEAYTSRGNAKSGLGRYEDAFKDHDKAIRLNSKIARAYNNRGGIKIQLGRYEDAIKDFDEALRLLPKYVEAYIDRGIARSELARRAAKYYANRGVANSKLGRHENAIKDYGEAIRLDPKEAGYYYSRSQTRFETHDYKGAFEDLAKTRKYEHDNEYTRDDTFKAFSKKVSSALAAQKDAIKGATPTPYHSEPRDFEL